MARCCGSTGTCACKVDPGRMIQISGSGTSGDPFVISSDTFLSVEGNTTFDLGLSGAGTLAEPWVLTVRFADESIFSGLPQVSDTAPTNGQVLGWNSATQMWEPKPPTTAAPGAISHDTSLSGDGSSGSALQVNEDPARYLQTSGAGLGLNNAGIARLIRPYSNATDRAADTIPPINGSMSILASNPGVVEYWDGSSWQPITNGIQPSVVAGELLALSGAYGGGPLADYVAQVSVTTGADGTFDVLSSSTLATYAGVLHVSFQETGNVTPWKAMVYGSTDRVKGRAYRLDTGAVLASTPVTGVVRALLY